VATVIEPVCAMVMVSPESILTWPASAKVTSTLGPSPESKLLSDDS
jgi:hypothetical protein